MLCDLCQDRIGVDMHHIIPKSATMGNQAQREASEVPQLMAFVCRECHEKRVDIPEYRDQLFLRLYEIYGEDSVRTAFERFQSLRRYPLQWRLPNVKK